MVKGEKGDYELNYVYNAAKDQEFKSVHVVLKILNNKIRLSINSETDVGSQDLKTVIAGLQKELFSKIGVDIRQECAVYLYVKGMEYYIDYGKEMKVYKLEYTI